MNRGKNGRGFQGMRVNDRGDIEEMCRIDRGNNRGNNRGDVQG